MTLEVELDETASGHTIEAHGIKGMKRTPWRKTFKHTDHLNDWAEKNDADVHGTRDLEKAKKGNLSPAMKEEIDLEEAIKLGTKVKMHAPGKDYHDQEGHVGEIRHGAYKGAPKKYTVDYGNGKSVQLDKGNLKHQTEEVVNELSTELLARYKVNARAKAKLADLSGNYAKGNKLFKGINKATSKQFDNDLKKHGQMKEGTLQGNIGGGDGGGESINRGMAEGKDEKIAQLKKDHETAVHWSKNDTNPHKREAARQKAEKIKAHLEKQYKQGVAEEARIERKEESTDYHAQAEMHMSKANDADAKGDKKSFHAHMADHHDSMSEWHDSKGRSASADKHAEKADYHHEKSLSEETTPYYNKSSFLKRMGRIAKQERQAREKKEKEAKPVKEDTHMEEALKGDQHKIDANKNGKLDKYDFSKLRALKKMREEREALEENYDDRRGFGKRPREDDEYHVPDPEMSKKDKKKVQTESTVPDRMKGKQKPYVSSDGKGNYEVLGNTGQTKQTFTRKEHGALARVKAQDHLKKKYDAYMKEETKKEDPPFDGPYTKVKANVKDKSGAVHTPMSRARDLARDAMKKQMKEDIDRLFEAKDEQEYGYEGDMAMNQLSTLVRCAEMIKDVLKPDTDLPEWVQSKITLATDYIVTAADYLHSELEEQAPVAPGLDKKYIKGTPENKAYKATKKPINGMPTNVKEEVVDEAKPGLYANINAKRKRIEAGSKERMRKPGSKGAPSASDFKDAAKTVKESVLDEANHREFASQGKMHPDMVKNMSVGSEHDYYEPKTGDKVSGKVMHKSATEVHMKQTHDSYDPKKKGTVHKFKITNKLEEETTMEFTQEELQLIGQFIEIAEKLNMDKATMGDVIKDFKLDEVGDTLAGQKKLAQVKSRAEKRAVDDRSATDSKYAFKQHAANVRSSGRMNQPMEESDKYDKLDAEDFKKLRKEDVTVGSFAAYSKEGMDESMWPGSPEYKKKFPDSDREKGTTKKGSQGTIIGTGTGVKHERDYDKAEKETSAPEGQEKRGRGRPKGASSGARQKGM